MIKFKNSTTSNENSLCSTRRASVTLSPRNLVKPVTLSPGKLSPCFHSNLDYCRNLNFSDFIGGLFHKTLSLKFDEFIPYF